MVPLSEMSSIPKETREAALTLLLPFLRDIQGLQERKSADSPQLESLVGHLIAFHTATEQIKQCYIHVLLYTIDDRARHEHRYRDVPQLRTIYPYVQSSDEVSAAYAQAIMVAWCRSEGFEAKCAAMEVAVSGETPQNVLYKILVDLANCAAAVTAGGYAERDPVRDGPITQQTAEYSLPEEVRARLFSDSFNLQLVANGLRQHALGKPDLPPRPQLLTEFFFLTQRIFDTGIIGCGNVLDKACEHVYALCDATEDNPLDLRLARFLRLPQHAVADAQILLDATGTRMRIFKWEMDGPKGELLMKLSGPAKEVARFRGAILVLHVVAARLQSELPGSNKICSHCANRSVGGYPSVCQDHVALAVATLGMEKPRPQYSIVP